MSATGRLPDGAASPTGQPTRNGNRVDSFRHAFAGVWHVLRTQRNAQIHAAATAAVIALGLWLSLGVLEWAVLVVVIGMVWAAEFTNTALEALVDLASPNHHPLAKTSKDVMSAAVLVASITAAVVGLLVMGPPLWARVGPLVTDAVR